MQRKAIITKNQIWNNQTFVVGRPWLRKYQGFRKQHVPICSTSMDI